MQRPLTGDSKLRQKPSNGDRAQGDIEFDLDQPCHHFPRPQGKRKFELHWVLLCHRVVNKFHLLAVKSRRATKQWLGFQRAPANAPILCQPAVNRRTTDTNNASHYFRTFAVVNAAHGTLAHRLQSGVIQPSGVVGPHDSPETHSFHPFNRVQLLTNWLIIDPASATGHVRSSKIICGAEGSRRRSFSCSRAIWSTCTEHSC